MSAKGSFNGDLGDERLDLIMSPPQGGQNKSRGKMGWSPFEETQARSLTSQDLGQPDHPGGNPGAS